MSVDRPTDRVKVGGNETPYPSPPGCGTFPPQRSLRSLGGLYGVGYVQPAFEW